MVGGLMLSPGELALDLWPTSVGNKVTPSPRRGSPSVRVLEEYIARLESVGLPDPAGCREAVDRAAELRASITEPPTRAAITQALAEGSIDADQAQAQLEELRTRIASARDTKKLLVEAGSRVLTACVGRIVAHGDNHLTDLQPLLADLLSSRKPTDAAESRYNAINGLIRFLDRHGWLPVPVNPPHLFERRYATPLAVHLWRLDRAKHIHIKASARAGSRSQVHLLVREAQPAAWPTLTDERQHRDEWQPGIYTAEAILTHARASYGRSFEDIAREAEAQR